MRAHHRITEHERPDDAVLKVQQDGARLLGLIPPALGALERRHALDLAPQEVVQHIDVMDEVDHDRAPTLCAAAPLRRLVEVVVGLEQRPQPGHGRDLPDRVRLAREDALRGDDVRVEASVVARQQQRPRALLRRGVGDEGLAAGDVGREGLLAEDADAGGQQLGGDGGVRVVGRADDGDVGPLAGDPVREHGLDRGEVGGAHSDGELYGARGRVDYADERGVWVVSDCLRVAWPDQAGADDGDLDRLASRLGARIHGFEDGLRLLGNPRGVFAGCESRYRGTLGTF